MRPDLMIEVAVPIEPLLWVTNRFVRVEIGLLIREAPPEAFPKYMTPPAAGVVDDDLHAVRFQHPCELQARELASLIRVEDIWGRYCVIASRTASRQESVVSVWDSRHANTRRLAQSRTAKRYMKPRRMGL